MLEIIALIFLCKQIGNIALRKGLKPGIWKLYTIFAWISFEFIGFIIGIILFGFNKNDLIGLMAFGLASAFGGYLVVKTILDKKPDSIDEDNIRNIGSDL